MAKHTVMHVMSGYKNYQIGNLVNILDAKTLKSDTIGIMKDLHLILCLIFPILINRELPFKSMKIHRKVLQLAPFL